MKNMTTPFQVSEFTIAGLVRRESYIRVAVLGYWSSDVISVYVDRSWSSEGKWNINVNHSSGGRDTAEIANDADAEYNFALGLMEACRIAKDLQSRVDELEAEYQLYRAEIKAAEDAKKAEFQAAIDADTPIGSNAALIVATMQVSAATKPGVDIVRKFFKRGTNNTVEITANKLGRIVFRVNGVATKRESVIAIIENLSNRTV